MKNNKKALIIFPTYNEKENIDKIIPAALEKDPRLNVLVVDDGSPDGTGDIADRMAAENPRINVLHRDKKEGLGRAYIAGFKWALEHGFDYIFEMDADFSHNPDYLPDFLMAIEENDLVLGSRYICGVNVINWPMGRLLMSYYANVYARIVTGLPVRDGTGGFKCFRREVLEAIDLDAIRSNGYIFQIEVSLRVWKKGFKIKEIPIVFTDRLHGASKMSKKIVREAIWKVWYLRLMSILGKLK
jgi:dolichol-phosphate mannosyltransferase